MKALVKIGLPVTALCALVNSTSRTSLQVLGYSNDRRKTKRDDSSLFSEAIPEEERNPDYLPWVAFLFKQEKVRQSVKNYLF